MRRTLFSLLLPALLWGALPAANAQNAMGERVIRSWTDDVKLDDGLRALWTFTVTYDADAGEYIRTTTDESGALIERTIQTSSVIPPNQEEIEMARAVIFADPELSELYERADNPVLSGGFVLQREAGHSCGPGSRCLQFDMVNVDVPTRRVDRIRFVVVDVRDGTLVSNDFDPSEGNVSRPTNDLNPNQ